MLSTPLSSSPWLVCTSWRWYSLVAVSPTADESRAAIALTWSSLPCWITCWMAAACAALASAGVAAGGWVAGGASVGAVLTVAAVGCVAGVGWVVGATAGRVVGCAA